MLYDRPVSALMLDFANQVGRPFKPVDAVDWFARNYPEVKPATVRAHLIGLTDNDPNRHHYKWLATKTPLFRKLSTGQLVELASDESSDDPLDEGRAWAQDAPSNSNVAEQQMEFALEAYLEEFLLTNWQLIDWGRRLDIWEGPDSEVGHQYSIPVGRLDFLAIDLDSGALVVIELKRGRPSDQVVGQIARYMGWFREEFVDDGQPVEGIVVAGDADDRLYYAARAVPGLSVLLYEVNFGLRHATR